MDQDSANPEQVRTGATIRALREAYGLSREELGKALGKSARYLRYIESGERPAGIVLCRQIADQLGVPLAAITMAGYDDIKVPSARHPARTGAAA